MLLFALACQLTEPHKSETTPSPPTSTTPPSQPVDCDSLAPLPGWASLDGERLMASCPSHDLYVDSSNDGILRLQYVRSGAPPDRRSFAVSAPLLSADVSAGRSGQDVLLCSPDLTLSVTPDCRIRVTDALGTVLLDDGIDGGFRDLGASVAVRRSTPPDEHFYGLGERTGGLEKRGTSVVFRNTDAYDTAWGAYRPDQDPLYVSIPFLLSLRQGRAAGVFTDSPYTGALDLADSEPEAWTWSTEGDRIDQYIIAGPEIASVVRRYTDLTGRVPLPPLWALGYHQCRWGYWPDDRLYELADEFRTRRIPADTLWLDIQHMDGFRTFTFDPVGFPDPAALASDLEAMGFHLVVIADPGLKQDFSWSVWNEALAGDHLLQWPDGSPYIGTVWPGESGFPDFSRPQSRAFWAEQVSGLASLGIDGIWLDVNEPTTFPEGGAGLTVDDAVPADSDGLPTTMAEIHNVYGQLQAMATVDGLRTTLPERRPFVLSRAGYAGIQRYAATWTGDVSSSFDGLSLSLPMLLGLGLSGQPFVGSDVGGYSGRTLDGQPTSPELFARWMALGVLSPFLRGHATSGAPDQEPWAFGTEVQDISRIHIDWRYRMLPYLYALMDEAQRTGAPPLRPLLWEFQADARMLDLSDQAMLGPWLLAAPVLTQGAVTRTVVLPEGRWYEFHSGAIWEGPDEVVLSVTQQALPLFVRQGAILPIAPPGRQHTAEPISGPMLLDLYPSDSETTFMGYEDAGDGYGPSLRTTWTLSGTASGAVLRAEREGDYDPGPRDQLLRFRRFDTGASAVRLDGVSLSALDSREALDSTVGFWFDSRDLSVWVHIIDPGEFTLEIDADRTVIDPRPPVEILLRVTVPEGTPSDPPIHVASDATGWVHTPLAWEDASYTVATGTLTVPRGEWYLFKYSRGDWCTVEKYPDCEEASDRYALGAASLDRQDVVYGWRDWCEVCP